MKNFLYRVIVLLIFLPLYGAAQVGFNKGGYNSIVNDGSFYYSSVKNDSQKKIIVAGRGSGVNGPGLIVRFNNDGTQDTSFNIVNIFEPIGSVEYKTVLIDSQDRVIVIGQALVNNDDQNGVIARYNQNGILDTSFNNNNGFLNADLPTNTASYESGILDGQGRIIVVGKADTVQGLGTRGLIARYLESGALDLEFNNNTGFAWQVPNDSLCYYGVTLDRQGRIIAVGQTFDFSDGLIARFNPNGELDQRFDLDGFINVQNGTNSSIFYGVAIDNQDRIVVVGQTDSTNGDRNGIIARYKEDGALDLTFNPPNGFINVDLPFDSNAFRGLIIDEQGKILVVGHTDTNNNQTNGIIAKFNTDGSLDTTFNKIGYINTEKSEDSARFNGITIDSQNKIIVVGYNDQNHGLIARYLSNGVLDTESNWNTNNYRESANINNISIGLLG